MLKQLRRSLARPLPAAVAASFALALAACGPAATPGTAGAPSSEGSNPERPAIVVTYSILGSVVSELVGNAASVTVLMPNGADPHEWEPSAKGIETVMKADLLVQNGLDLESGMATVFDQAKQAGVKTFIASDHIQVRHVGPGEGISSGDPDQAVGAADPHLWMDPLTVEEVVAALSSQLKSDLNLDVSAGAATLESRLVKLDEDVGATLSAIPQDQRKLVTGHESLGYFAQRYGLTLIGALVPSLTTQAEVSAAQLAKLAETIRQEKVKAIFTELGTPASVSDAIASETGVKVVEITTHSLPPDGSYFTFMTNLATLIADNLK